MPPPLGRLADRGDDGGGLQPVERRLQAVVAQAGIAAADEGEDLIRCGGHRARRAQPAVARVDDLAGGPDQHVGVPDRGHAVLRGRFDADRYLAHAEVDRRHTTHFGEGKNGQDIKSCASRAAMSPARPEEFELLTVV